MLYFLLLLFLLACDVNVNFFACAQLKLSHLLCSCAHDCSTVCISPSVVGLFHLLPFTCTPLLSLAMQSMQRALSSDTLNVVALSDTVACRHNSDPQHDVRQPLSHSQSMFLPENGKVPAPRAQLCSRQTQKKKMHKIKKKQKTSNKSTFSQDFWTPFNSTSCLFSWSTSAEITPVM